MVDFNYRKTSARRIANAILKNGAAMLRGAVPPENVAAIKANIDRIYALHRRLIDRDAEAVAFFAGWQLGQIEALNEGDVFAPLYQAAFGKTATIYSFLDDPKFKQVCALVFPRGEYHRTGTDTLMTVRPPSRNSQEEKNTTPGIDLHTDGMYFNDSRFGLTVWLPLDRCGRDAPGLETILAGHEEVRRYTGFDRQRPVPSEPRWNWHHYEEGVFAEEKLRRHFPRERWFAPEFSGGDLMVLSNWALHGSYREPGMSRPRSAVQVRLEGNSFDPNKPARSWTLTGVAGWGTRLRAWTTGAAAERSTTAPDAGPHPVQHLPRKP